MGNKNHRCLSCDRQFVEYPTNKGISEKNKELLNRLLLKHISLACIARCIEVCEIWIQKYISKLYASQPDALYASIPNEKAMQALTADTNDVNTPVVSICKPGRIKNCIQHIFQPANGSVDAYNKQQLVSSVIKSSFDTLQGADEGGSQCDTYGLVQKGRHKQRSQLFQVYGIMFTHRPNQLLSRPAISLHYFLWLWKQD